MAACAPARRSSRPALRALLLVPLLLALIHLRSDASANAFNTVVRPSARRGFAGACRGAASSRPQLRRCAAELAESGSDSAAAPAEAKGTVLGSAASVAKGIVGSGILSLASGVAAFSSAPQGLYVALVMLLAMTAISAYTFRMVAEVSADTGARDFGDAWTATMGEKSSWVPRAAVCVISGISCIIYSMVLGDSLAAIIKGFLTGSGAGALAGWKAGLLPWCTRTPVLLALTVGVLLPLCMVESFANLAFTSMIGLAGCVYIAAFVLFRFLDGSYAAGGHFMRSAPFLPAKLVAARKLSDILNIQTLVLLCNFGMAYMNHGVAPGMYQELAVDRKEGESAEAVRKRKMGRYDRVILMSFGFAGIVAGIVMAGGFATFGSSTVGYLLANYANTDPGATIARLCVMTSLIFGFPLNFVLIRFEAEAALERRSGKAVSRTSSQQLTVAMLAVITAAAIVLSDLGKVQAVAGATVGSFVVFVAPALMKRALRKKRGEGAGAVRAAGEAGLVALGVFTSIVGLGVSLTA